MAKKENLITKSHDALANLIFTAKITKTMQDVDDLLVSAFEGGCNYWLRVRPASIKAESKKYGGEMDARKQILLGGTLECFDIETGDKLGDLTLLKILAALQAMANGEDLKGEKNDHLTEHFNDFSSDNADAVTADVVVQIAIMGSIVFG